MTTPDSASSTETEFLWHEAEERGDRLAFLLRAAREVVEWHTEPRCGGGVVCDDCILLTRIDAELDGSRPTQNEQVGFDIPVADAHSRDDFGEAEAYGWNACRDYVLAQHRPVGNEQEPRS